MFPFLFFSILKKEWYGMFFKLARVWATVILFGMGFLPKVKRDTKHQKGISYMFVSNHTSMTDIMLMLYLVKNPFVFVGKKELSKIPLFGFFYKRTCILVDRKNPKSRHEVFQSAQARIDQGFSICIFPEGGVPNDMSIVLDTFKDGAFRLATDHALPIAPMTFHDNKARFPYIFFSGTPGKMRARIHELIPSKGKMKRDVKEEVRGLIEEELIKPTIH
jgi:1-acyl-sn-glycerol-3-phosphate acyltransferase